MTEQSANLNITDIADAVKVIDYASEQGAFKGWTNIRQILALRDRLDLFVSAAAQAAAEEGSVPAEAATDEPAVEEPVAAVESADELPPVARRRRPRLAAR